MNNISRKQEFNNRLSTLKTERSEWDGHWKELNDYIQPRTSRFFASDRNKGSKVNQRIIDSTAGFALGTFMSGMMAGTTSPARPWFQLTTFDPDLKEFKSVKSWLYQVASALREVFSKSNIYNVFPLAYRDLGLYGTSSFSLLPDWEKVIRAYPFPVGSYCLATSPRGEVDTCIREYSYTVRQLVDKFGKDNCSAAVRTAYDTGKYDQWIDVVHVVAPRTERDETKKDAKNKPFLSCWFEKSSDDGSFLLESGYDDYPVMSPRWDVLGEDIYGHSPAMEVLGDVKALQKLNAKYLKAADKMIDPPLLADTILQNQSISMLPGGVTFVANLQAAGGAKSVHDVPPQMLGPVAEQIVAHQERIKRAFYADLMLMFATSDNTQMTAREVEERHQEKLLVLGPYMERLNNELFDKVITRTFSIMNDRGMIPPPPRELQGQELKVEYISMMAQAQKLIGLTGLERLVGFVGNVAAAAPDSLDKLDIDQCIDEYADMVGSPPRAVRSDDEVAAIREQRQQAQQAQQLAALAQPMAQAAQGAKALSETNVTDVNALTRLLTGAV